MGAATRQTTISAVRGAALAIFSVGAGPIATAAGAITRAKVCVQYDLKTSRIPAHFATIGILFTHAAFTGNLFATGIFSNGTAIFRACTAIFRACATGLRQVAASISAGGSAGALVRTTDLCRIGTPLIPGGQTAIIIQVAYTTLTGGLGATIVRMDLAAIASRQAGIHAMISIRIHQRREGLAQGQLNGKKNVRHRARTIAIQIRPPKGDRQTTWGRSGAARKLPQGRENHALHVADICLCRFVDIPGGRQAGRLHILDGKE